MTIIERWGRRAMIRKFREAQDPMLHQVVYDLCYAAKQGHYMWFFFPQAPGLGVSEMSRRFALTDDDARAFWADPVLGGRLRLFTWVVMERLGDGTTLEYLFGTELDALKFRSCMDLFARATGESLFRRATELVGATA